MASPLVIQHWCKPFKQVRAWKIRVSGLNLDVAKQMGMSLKHQGGKNVHFTAVDYISQLSGRNYGTGLVRKSSVSCCRMLLLIFQKIKHTLALCGLQLSESLLSAWILR